MKYGLIGGNLSHSYSALVHREFGYEYVHAELKKEELQEFVKSGVFDAFNVTIPYKKEVIAYLDELSAEASALQSVNTVINRGGKLIGYNTDYYGMRYILNKAGIELKDKKVLVLGSGGTSNTALAVARDAHAREVVTVGRNSAVNYTNYNILHSDAQVLINTTPVGMYPNNGGKPVELALLPKLEGVGEVIYNPLKSALALEAEALGIKCTDGLLMLVAQAKYARDLFLGEPADDSLIDSVFCRLKKRFVNFVLIGMPSSGKTTKGRMLAERTNRCFVDTDSLIVERSGKSIARIFEDEGEEVFREMEREVLAQITKKTGQVIATGGGAVLSPINREGLKQNGIVIYIKRDINNLETSGRPLAKDKAALQALFDKRKAIYERLADIVVESENIEECVTQIEEKINEYFGN